MQKFTYASRYDYRYRCRCHQNLYDVLQIAYWRQWHWITVQQAPNAMAICKCGLSQTRVRERERRKREKEIEYCFKNFIRNNSKHRYTQYWRLACNNKNERKKKK